MKDKIRIEDLKELGVLQLDTALDTKLFFKPKVKFVTYLKMVIRPDQGGGRERGL